MISFQFEALLDSPLETPPESFIVSTPCTVPPAGPPAGMSCAPGGFDTLYGRQAPGSRCSAKESRQQIFPSNGGSDRGPSRSRSRLGLLCFQYMVLIHDRMSGRLRIQSPSSTQVSSGPVHRSYASAMYFCSTSWDMAGFCQSLSGISS